MEIQVLGMTAFLPLELSGSTRFIVFNIPENSNENPHYNRPIVFV